MYKIEAEVDYVVGYLRSGYYVLYLNEEAFEEYQALSDEEKKEYLEEEGEFKLDDVSIEEIGPIINIKYSKAK